MPAWGKRAQWLARSLPGPRAWRAATGCLAVAGALFWIALWHSVVHPVHPLWLHGAFLALGPGLGAGTVVIWRTSLARLGHAALARRLEILPVAACCLAGAECAVVLLGDEARWPAWVGFALAGSVGLAAAEIRDSRLARPGRRVRIAVTALGVAASAALAWTFFLPSREAPVHDVRARAIDEAAGSVADAGTLEAALGSRRAGPAPRRLRYGAPDAGAARTRAWIPSRTVDARPLLAGWSGFSGWLRTRTFGFGPEALPLAGAVWLPPEGARAPHPLIVVAHGNHPMPVPSHGGFGYLCDALARAGYVCASVDLRFLNASYTADAFGGLDGDRAVRAWMLLEHLALWRTWSATSGHPLAGVADLDQVGLVGHSRGGAAVVLAAEWNALGRIPGAPEVALPERFGIRSVSALAPIEIRPADHRADGLPTLDGISYLALHGGRDADVRAFEAALQYERTRTEGASGALKQSLYLDRANHNHFNTLWHPVDKPPLLAPLVDRRGIMSGEAQRAVTTAVVVHFLDAVHRGSRDGDWLASAEALVARIGDQGVAHRFRDAATLEIAGFDEDADPVTATVAGGRIVSDGLVLAREERLEMRWQGVYSPSRALRLAWAREPGRRAPQLIVALPGDTAGLGSRDALLLDLAVDPRDPRTHGAVTLSVELADAAGRRARARIAGVGKGGGPGRARLYHADCLNPRPEILFETHALRLADFAEADPGFDGTRLREVRLVLDGTREGALLVGGIGLRRPG